MLKITISGTDIDTIEQEIKEDAFLVLVTPNDFALLSIDEHSAAMLTEAQELVGLETFSAAFHILAQEMFRNMIEAAHMTAATLAMDVVIDVFGPEDC